MKGPALAPRIGQAFRRRREALGFSQEGFADEIRMHRTQYSALERGEKNITLGTLERVCDGLKISVWDLFRDAGKDR